MRIPKDSLEEFFASRAAPKQVPPPPGHVALESSGEIEVLKPLARWEAPVLSDRRDQPEFLSWFHRSLVFGGALATLVLVLGTGMFLALFGPPVETVSEPRDLAINELALDALSIDDEVGTADLFTSNESPFAVNEPAAIRSIAKRRTFRPRVRSTVARSRVLFAANRVRHRAPVPKMIWSDFVPTNMVIFVENGAVKTRIEPQLTTVYNRAPAGLQ